MTYQPIRPSRSAFVRIRTLDYHVRLWGDGADAQAPPLVLLHGWMDVAASYQFVVDAFGEDFFRARTIIAPDWRGFGLSKPPAPCDHYLFVDYLADLDFLLDHFAGDRPVDLVGHSMGGNVAMHYAGARPARIRRLIDLEGFGMPAADPRTTPAHCAQWMDELKLLYLGKMALQSYDGPEGVAQRLNKTNPRLAPDKAAWLARHWAQPGEDGRWRILGDPAHKVVGAYRSRVEEVLALYAAISAPTLVVEASDNGLRKWSGDTYTLEEFHARLRHVRDCRRMVVPDAGHMLHHDQPEAVARLIEQFVS